MYCPRCEKEYSGSIRLCPECFGDLEQSAGSLPAAAHQLPPPAQSYQQLKDQVAPRPSQPVQLPPAAPVTVKPTTPTSAPRVTILDRRRKSALPGVLMTAALLAICFGVGAHFLRGKAPASSAKKASSESVAADLLGQARQLYEAREFDAAAELGKRGLEALIEEGADTDAVVKAREFVGQACCKAEQYPEAILQYETLAKLRPDNAEYRRTRDAVAGEYKKHRRGLAMGKVQQGRDQMATGSLIKAIHLGEEAAALLRDNQGSKHELASAYRLIGKAYYKKGDYRNAGKYLRLAIGCEPDAESKSMLATLQEPVPAALPSKPAASQPPAYASTQPAPPARPAYPSSRPSYPTASRQSPSYPSSSYSSSVPVTQPANSYSSLGKGSAQSPQSYSSSPTSSSYSSSSATTTPTYKAPSRVQSMRSSESRLGQGGPSQSYSEWDYGPGATRRTIKAGSE